MAKQTISQHKTGDPQIAESLSTMNVLNGKLMAYYAEAGQTALMNAVKMNQELMRFAGERFQADVQALQTMSRCANWSELADCQTDFARKTTEAYEAELSKLMRMGSDATSETLQPLRHAAETGAEAQATE
jgi:hypothetical protein